ncbi:MAG TPA: serine/threonine-protein kinase, partial [Pseudomonadota bacterium]|nr:serine/threonine-protein kinase [Pseudomonadota bacterium]
AQRFLTEAKALAIARHPGLVHIFDYGQLPDGTLFLLMEYLEGESLASRMQRRAEEAKAPPTAGRPPGMRSSQAVRLARQISDALTVTHEKGIYHRDLKPSNIFVVPDSEAPGGERVKILDFGLARIRPSSEGAAAEAGAGAAVARTSTSVVMGTPLYMAPEQCRGLAQADGPSDVYALGVMLYELLAGAPPFTGNTASDLIAMHIYQPPPPLGRRVAGLPRALSSLVMSMLRKDPAERPTMAQVAQTLRELEREPTVLAAPTTTGPSRRLVLVCGAAALLALLWLLSAPLRNPSPATKRPPLHAPPRAVAPIESPPPPSPAAPSGPVGVLPASPSTSPGAVPVVAPAAPSLPPPAAPLQAAPSQPETASAPDRRPARPSLERTMRRPADKPAKPSAGTEKTPGQAAAPPPTPAASVAPAAPPEKPKEEEVHVPALR